MHIEYYGHYSDDVQRKSRRPAYKNGCGVGMKAYFDKCDVIKKNVPLIFYKLSAENIAEGACYIERYHTIYLYRCENEYQYEMNGSRTPLENGIFYFVGNGSVTVEKA